MERDLEKMRVEKNILYNYVRDSIVKGILLINVNRYIRNKTKAEKELLLSGDKNSGNNPYKKNQTSLYSQSYLSYNT